MMCRLAVTEVLAVEVVLSGLVGRREVVVGLRMEVVEELREVMVLLQEVEVELVLKACDRQEVG